MRPPRPEDVLRLVPAPLRAAAGIHVVGGAVRDVLLEREPAELDILVEGDAIALARELDSGAVVHERFGTATVRLDGRPVDLAGTRREWYPRPGALPEVELGVPVAVDLERRDFTVNAIAVRTADGHVSAHPAALEDLREGLLRVLHDRSFPDDPTRLLRLVRYGARLGFAPDARTAALAAEAVAGGATTTVSGARLGAELRLLLGEPQPAGLLGLAAHGIGAALFGAYAPDGARIARARELCPPDGDRDAAALGAALLDPAASAGAGARAAALEERLRELSFAARRRTVVAGAVRDAAGIAALLAGAPAASALHARLRRVAPEVVAVAGALAGADAAAAWLGTLRHVRLEIAGEDLRRAGLRGPAVGRGLDAALRARLDGAAPDRESQLRAALDP